MSSANSVALVWSWATLNRGGLPDPGPNGSQYITSLGGSATQPPEAPLTRRHSGQLLPKEHSRVWGSHTLGHLARRASVGDFRDCPHSVIPVSAMNRDSSCAR